MEIFNKYRHLIYAIILIIGLALYLQNNRYHYPNSGTTRRIDNWTGERQFWNSRPETWDVR